MRRDTPRTPLVPLPPSLPTHSATHPRRANQSRSWRRPDRSLLLPRPPGNRSQTAQGVSLEESPSRAPPPVPARPAEGRAVCGVERKRSPPPLLLGSRLRPIHVDARGRARARSGGRGAPRGEDGSTRARDACAPSSARARSVRSFRADGFRHFSAAVHLASLSSPLRSSPTTGAQGQSPRKQYSCSRLPRSSSLSGGPAAACTTSQRFRKRV